MDERLTALIERGAQREERIQRLENTLAERLVRLEEKVQQNSADIQTSNSRSFASMVGVGAFLLKEFLRLLQERKR